ncbi:MAG: HAMP domain-containing histidine kinase, partial [Psychrosphaera sp.]|nr:HAMP domain-containing histidine kinase [Psychrosphaera sp.]
MSNSRSITTFITTRLLLLFGAFIVCYSFIVNHVYLWGMDETTEYYMFTEAQIIMESYQSPDVITQQEPGFREYYWPQQLPQSYKEQFPAYISSINRTLMITTERSAIYLLPVSFGLDELAVDIYVVHILPDVDAADGGSGKIRQLLIILAVATLALLLLMIGWFVYRLVNATLALSLWAEQLNSDNHSSLAVPDKTRYFAELNHVAQKLRASFSELAEFNRREQQFLRSLSHELRTPIAVISAALDVLDKKNKDQGLAKLVGKIRRASNTMRALTETILWLWRDPSAQGASGNILIKPIIEQSIIDNQYLLKNKTVSIDNQLGEGLAFVVDKTLLTIICNNLIRNAFQYCDEDTVVITAGDNLICINNTCSSEIDTLLDADYGFGLGLLIVQRIVDSHECQLHIDK